MKTTNLLSNILLVTFLSQIVGCAEEEVITDRPFPRLKTLIVTEVSDAGAIFNAEFFNRGNSEILNYGFVWSRSEQSPVVDLNNRLIVTSNITEKQFSERIETTLFRDTEYAVRAFAITETHTVYGEIQTFTSMGSGPPVISSIEPVIGTIGDSVTITGSGFSYVGPQNDLRFSDEFTVIISVSDTMMKAIIPHVLSDNLDVSLTIAGNRTQWGGSFQISSPVITSVSPVNVAVDDTLIIKGNNFSWDHGSNKVAFGGEVAKVISANKQELKISVPAITRAMSRIDLNIGGHTVQSEESITFAQPEIVSSDQILSFGDELVIQGENLSISVVNTTVNFDDTRSVVSTSNRNRIVARVPDKLESSSPQITVSIGSLVFDAGTVHIAAPNITSVEPSIIDSQEIDELKIIGENFNLIPIEHKVLIGGVSASVLSSNYEEIIIALPEELKMPTTKGKYDIQVSILNQTGILEDGLTVDL